MHTAGEWKWWTSNSWRRLRSEQDGGRTADVICPVVARDGHPDCIVSDADMRLIAAAPELYEALKAHKEWTDKERQGPVYPDGVSRDNGGEQIWREWWNEQLALCDRAQTLTESALAKACPPAQQQFGR